MVFRTKPWNLRKKEKKTSQKAQPTLPNLFESFCNFTTSERHPWPPTPPNFSDFATRRLHSLQAQPRDKSLARWPRSRHDGVITWNFLGSCCSFEGFNQTSTFQPLKIFIVSRTSQIFRKVGFYLHLSFQPVESEELSDAIWVKFLKISRPPIVRFRSLPTDFPCELFTQPV